MKATLKNIRQLALSARMRSRALVHGVGGFRLSRSFFIPPGEENDAAMKAFRKALLRRFGIVGRHAFDSVLDGRAQLHKPLRARDVLAALAGLRRIRRIRYAGELARQLDTDPKILELPAGLQKKVRRAAARIAPDSKKLKACRTPADFSRMAAGNISLALERLVRSAPHKKKRGHSGGTMFPAAAPEPVGAREPMGLRDLGLMFARGETSVEDQVRKGTLGAGMRVNRSASRPVLLEKLKSLGVEPGFIYRHDWSVGDTWEMMSDAGGKASLAALEEHKRSHPDCAAACAHLSLRRQIMLLGRSHPAGMAAVAEHMLEKGMADRDSAMFLAFARAFPGVPPDQWRKVPLRRVKKALFVEIRDAVMGVREQDEEYALSPVFRHFAERHILKLDYGEEDRVIRKSPASSGLFMRPERSAAARGALGPLFRLAMARSADAISARAVWEALANDLARICGVPAQELSIVRGQYSDGHPKLMLQAAFEEGFRNLGRYIADGQIVPPQGERVESLGRYKAFFLVIADKDAVGASGKNKGFAGGRFFAIDPGHSLEGNGRCIDVDDDFSFRIGYRFPLRPRFKNFSVFDDDTRFARLMGALDLRDAERSGRFERLFAAYRAAFDPGEAGISPAEKALRVRIVAGIGEKESEFRENLAGVLRVVGEQIRLYDDLAPAGAAVREKAVETIGNLEKLTSPTTWVSPGGTIPLKHLAVLPGKRAAWRGRVDGDSIVYRCGQPLSPRAAELLRAFAASAGARLETFPDGLTALTIPLSVAETALDAFAEKNVAEATHPQEARLRQGS